MKNLAFVVFLCIFLGKVCSLTAGPAPLSIAPNNTAVPDNWCTSAASGDMRAVTYSHPSLPSQENMEQQATPWPGSQFLNDKLLLGTIGFLYLMLISLGLFRFYRKKQQAGP